MNEHDDDPCPGCTLCLRYRQPLQCIAEAASQAVGEILAWIAGWEGLPHNLLGLCYHCNNWRPR